jgi:hypothetical protein
MNPHSSVVRNRLTWSKIPHTPNYELKLNEKTTGILSRPSYWSPRFLAETRDGRWVFRRQGFLGTGVEITDAVSEEPIAAFKSSCGGGGRLIFSDGQGFWLKYKGWWRPVWTVTTDDGQLVLEVHTREKTVELRAAKAVPSIRLSLLITFSWSRVLQADEDASAASVAAVVSAA